MSPNKITYLLTEYRPRDKRLLSIYKMINQDSGIYKLIINTFFDSELMVYIDRIIDYKLEPKDEIETSMDIVTLDVVLSKFYGNISNTTLRNIAIEDYLPIRRIAACMIDYLIKANMEYNNG